MVRTRVVMLAGILIVLFLLGWASSTQLVLAQAPPPTAPAATTPPVLPVETGANAPLLCGAIAILIIIVGGVIWNGYMRQARQEDH